MAKRFDGKKLGALMEESADLLIRVGEASDIPKLEAYALREVDPVRALLAFLLALEKADHSDGKPKLKREVQARGTALVGTWMLARANAAAAEVEQRTRGVPHRFFVLKRGSESRRVEGRLTEATMEALRALNGVFGVLEQLGAERVRRAADELRGQGTAPAWPPKDDLSGGAVQGYHHLKAAMATNPDTFWLFGGALDDVLQATTATRSAETYTIPITWGPGAT